MWYIIEDLNHISICILFLILLLKCLISSQSSSLSLRQYHSHQNLLLIGLSGSVHVRAPMSVLTVVSSDHKLLTTVKTVPNKAKKKLIY